MLTQERNNRLQLFLAHALRAGEQNRAGVFNLVEEELAEVLDVHAALARVRYGHEAAHAGFRNILLHALDRTDDVRELADSARLDEDAVRMVLVDDLTECLAEIADQRTADAAGVHFRHLNAGFLHEAAVDADFTEFIFNQDDFLAGKRLFKQLLDERSLARAKKTGKISIFVILSISLWGYDWVTSCCGIAQKNAFAPPPDSKRILYTVFREKTRISGEKTRLVKFGRLLAGSQALRGAAYRRKCCKNSIPSGRKKRMKIENIV